jgi:hypothetical protein
VRIGEILQAFWELERADDLRRLVGNLSLPT